MRQAHPASRSLHERLHLRDLSRHHGLRLAIVARAVMSWLHPRRGTAVYRVNAVLVDVTEPYLGLFRRVIPVARIGGTGVDFSAVVALLVLLVLQVLVRL